LPSEKDRALLQEEKNRPIYDLRVFLVSLKEKLYKKKKKNDSSARKSIRSSDRSIDVNVTRSQYSSNKGKKNKGCKVPILDEVIGDVEKINLKKDVVVDQKEGRSLIEMEAKEKSKTFSALKRPRKRVTSEHNNERHLSDIPIYIECIVGEVENSKSRRRRFTAEERWHHAAMLRERENTHHNDSRKSWSIFTRNK
jgi:hypothetical protein